MLLPFYIGSTYFLRDRIHLTSDGDLNVYTIILVLFTVYYLYILVNYYLYLRLDHIYIHYYRLYLYLFIYLFVYLVVYIVIVMLLRNLVFLGLLVLCQCNDNNRYFCITAATVTRPSYLSYLIGHYIGVTYELWNDVVLSRADSISFTSFVLNMDIGATSIGGKWAMCYFGISCGNPIPDVTIKNYKSLCSIYDDAYTSDNLTLRVTHFASGVPMSRYIGIVMVVSDKVIKSDYYPEVTGSDVRASTMSSKYSVYDQKRCETTNGYINGTETIVSDMYRSKPCWYKLKKSVAKYRFTQTLREYEGSLHGGGGLTSSSVIDCVYGYTP